MGNWRLLCLYDRKLVPESGLHADDKRSMRVRVGNPTKISHSSSA